MVKMCQRNGKRVLLFQSLKERCDGLRSMQKSNVVGARNENCGERAGEQNMRMGCDR